MTVRVLIIGGSHGGIATASHLKKINPSVEVIIIEQSSTHDRILAVAPGSFRRKRVCSQLLFRV